MDKIKKQITRHTRKIRRHSPVARWWRRYGYKHTTLSLLFIVLFVMALDTALVSGLLLAVEQAGELGMFVAGVLFTSFFTAAPAVVILSAIADEYNPVYIALFAGLGTMLGDWIILRFFEDQVGYELKPIANKFGMGPMIRVIRSKAFRPVAVLISAVFIASPLPDEAGLALLGLTKLPMYKILAVTFALNTAGILILVLAARAVSAL